MSEVQIKAAKVLLKNNLAHHTDWIVLNQTMVTLTRWAPMDEALKQWLLPQLERHTNDGRKSVSGRAQKMILKLQS